MRQDRRIQVGLAVVGKVNDLAGARSQAVENGHRSLRSLLAVVGHHIHPARGVDCRNVVAEAVRFHSMVAEEHHVEVDVRRSLGLAEARKNGTDGYRSSRWKT